MALKVLKFVKRHKPADSRSVNPKEVNLKKHISRRVIIKLLKTKGKKEILEQLEKNVLP